MPECYHCRQWVNAGEPHDCWTTTEAALTRELPVDLREAWERIRETAVEYGDQRIYASHNSIMFSRRSCYFFVRPKRTFLEVCIFLGRPLRVPAVRRVVAASKTKFAHLIRVTHRDEVEAPVTDWLQEAYEFAGHATAKPASSKPASSKAASSKPASSKPASPRPASRTRAASKVGPSKPSPTKAAPSKAAPSKAASSKRTLTKPALSKPAPKRAAAGTAVRTTNVWGRTKTSPRRR